MASSGTAWSKVVLGLLGCQLALGTLYASAELGELPHYHDSNAYFELARVLRVDAHRGIAYPAFLAAADWLSGAPTMLRVIEHDHPGAPCTAPAGIVLVQLLQLSVCAAAFGYWLRTRDALPGGRRGSRGRTARAAALAVTALLVFDPLISHFALSVMPDALAMAASLAFCGALSRVALGGQTPARDGALLFVTFALASLLRPEKQFVLLGVALASAALWAWIARRDRAAFPQFPARIGFAAALVALAFAGSVLTERLVFRDFGRPSQMQIVLHARVIFPHLGDIQAELPEEVRRRFSETDIDYYDKHVLNPGAVMKRVTGGDTADAARLTEQMARTAWRERGPAIVFDTLKDGLENALPTFGFYPRLLALRNLGVHGYRELSRSDMLPWTHKLMTEHHPRISAAALGLSGTTFALLAGWGLLRCRAGMGSAARATIAAYSAWMPTVAFALGNAAVFALHADSVSPRYNIAMHAMLLALVYASALSAIERARERGT